MPIHDGALKNKTLKYFDADFPVYTETDASKKGIGIVLMQPDPNVQNMSKTVVPNNLRPVYYASMTLMTMESNYSNIERDVRHGL